MAKSEATVELENIKSVDLNTAQHQWNTYIDYLGAGYNDAYGWHEKTLNNMREMRRAASEAMFSIFSALSVGLAGGLVGGMLAPWVRGAQDSIAQNMIREAAREIVKETAKRVKDRATRVIFDRLYNTPSASPAPHAAAASQSMFNPAVENPLGYYLKLKAELGMCFSRLRDDVDHRIKEADKVGAPRAFGEAVREVFQGLAIVKDHPRSEHMPDPDKIAIETELAMWITWAWLRETDYWNTRYQYVLDGVDDNEELLLWELLELNPIVERLKARYPSKYHYLTLPVRYTPQTVTNAKLRRAVVKSGWGVDPFPLKTEDQANDKEFWVLNINALRVSGPFFSQYGDFLKKVADVVKSPQKVLTTMSSLPPIYKRQAT